MWLSRWPVALPAGSRRLFPLTFSGISGAFGGFDVYRFDQHHRGNDHPDAEHGERNPEGEQSVPRQGSLVEHVYRGTRHPEDGVPDLEVAEPARETRHLALIDEHGEGKNDDLGDEWANEADEDEPEHVAKCLGD